MRFFLGVHKYVPSGALFLEGQFHKILQVIYDLVLVNVYVCESGLV